MFIKNQCSVKFEDITILARFEHMKFLIITMLGNVPFNNNLTS